MVEPSAFLLLGLDQDRKDREIEALKNRYLDSDFCTTDFDSIYSREKKLSPQQLNETFRYSPLSKKRKRIILIRDVDALAPASRTVLVNYLQAPAKTVLVVLESSRLQTKDSFFIQLEPFVKIVWCRAARQKNVFDLADAITRKDAAKALGLLHALLQNKDKPLMILGGLFWRWDQMRDVLPLVRFKQGLHVLLDTDVKIKSGKLSDELALEVLVIRLSCLL